MTSQRIAARDIYHCPEMADAISDIEAAGWALPRVDDAPSDDATLDQLPVTLPAEVRLRRRLAILED